MAAQLNEVLMMENSRDFIPIQANTVIITPVPLGLHFLLDHRSQATSHGKLEHSPLLQLINWEFQLEKARGDRTQYQCFRGGSFAGKVRDVRALCF